MLRLIGKMPCRRLRTIKGWDLARSFRGSLSQIDSVVHDFPVFLAVESEGGRFLKIVFIFSTSAVRLAARCVLRASDRVGHVAEDDVVSSDGTVDRLHNVRKIKRHKAV